MHVPTGWMRDVYGNAHARGLLELLGQKGTVRYSDARGTLDLRPAEFQRALQKLERHGLIRIRAPRQAGERQVVFLELSSLGSVAVDLMRTFEHQLERVFAEHNITPQAADALLRAEGA